MNVFVGSGGIGPERLSHYVEAMWNLCEQTYNLTSGAGAKPWVPISATFLMVILIECLVLIIYYAFTTRS